MADSPPEAAFSVTELTLSVLDGFLAAAGLHLGEPAADGARLEQPEAVQAWIALKAASSLMDQLSPVMSEDARLPFQARLSFLLSKLEARGPRKPVKAATHMPVSSLKELAAASLSQLSSGARPEPQPDSLPSEPSGQTVPGLGLPKRGSGLLFPPKGS